jgi:hypothetical protein
VHDAGRVLEDDVIMGAGRVNDSYVRIRKAPEVESPSYDERLMENQLVELLAKTATEVRIGDMSAIWYKIRTASGVVGWSFGWFIDEEDRFLLQP